MFIHMYQGFREGEKREGNGCGGPVIGPFTDIVCECDTIRLYHATGILTPQREGCLFKYGNTLYSRMEILTEPPCKKPVHPVNCAW